MRCYPDMSDKYDREEAERLNAEPWQLELLKCNPKYVHWGPHEDYMCDKDSGWRSPMFFESWAEFELPLDELNEVANFYFSVERESVRCVSCDETGYASKAKTIADAFYDFQAFVDKVNGANSDGSPAFGGYNHDAINRHMLIKQRCKRLGYPVTCPECDGHGYVFAARDAHVSLTLWLLHPRKGASRGVEVGRIGERDLPAVFEYLANAAKRNASRFAHVVHRDRRSVKQRGKKGAA